jgi:hypothetical protein
MGQRSTRSGWDNLAGKAEADRIITAFQNQVCEGAVVLMAQDFQGTPAFYGRADIVRFLERTDVSKIRWTEYAVEHDSNLNPNHPRIPL